MNENTAPVVQRKPKAVATIRGLLEGDTFKKQVAMALPKHLAPDRFIRVALTALTRTPELANCDQHSFFSKLLTLSELGLEPDGRRAHLIPFKNAKRGCTEVQLIVDYKGLAELAMRSGVVSFLHADVVCENDEFEYDRGELRKHKIDFRKQRGAVYAVYSLCRFKDGSEKCEVMSKEDVEAIRRRSRAASSGPWVTDFNEMSKKTVFRRLSKWLPLSPEFRDAVEKDDDALEDERFAAAKPVIGTRKALFEASPTVEPPVTGEDLISLAPDPEPDPTPTSPPPDPVPPAETEPTEPPSQQGQVTLPPIEVPEELDPTRRTKAPVPPPSESSATNAVVPLEPTATTPDGYVKAIRAGLVTAGVTEDQLMAFCLSQKLAKTGQKLADLATSKLASLCERWPEVVTEIKQ